MPLHATSPKSDANLVACSETDTHGYYRTGHWLRAKHQQTGYDSGRRFERWALELVPIAPGWRILDAGCGWGRFTWSLIDDALVPAEHIVCCDLSEGMLRTAEEEARRRQQRVEFRVRNIEALPLRARSVDLAIAGHVLYHLGDIDRGVRELARVIKDDGWVLVTTNSDAIDPLVIDLHERALAALDIAFLPEAPSRFSMENGLDYLTRSFNIVETHHFTDNITFPDVQSFVDLYTTIGHFRAVMEDQAVPLEKRRRLAAEVREQASRLLETTGILRTDVLMGAFVCREPNR
ncbi:MAG: class I SAM-dependent methyltransferase [Thermomicrobiales bacterium]